MHVLWCRKGTTFPNHSLGEKPSLVPSDLCLSPFDLTAVPLHHSCPPPGSLHWHLWLPLCLTLSPIPGKHPSLPVPHQRGLGQHIRLWAASGSRWRRRRGEPCGRGGWKHVQVSHGCVPASPAKARLHPFQHVRQLVTEMPLGRRNQQPHPAHQPGSAQSGSTQTDCQVSETKTDVLAVQCGKGLTVQY